MPCFSQMPKNYNHYTCQKKLVKKLLKKLWYILNGHFRKLHNNRDPEIRKGKNNTPLKYGGCSHVSDGLYT
jgi:hypothetical protein